MLEPAFWKNRKVFLTGHTGFKGSWLCLWLNVLGVKVTGYALDPPTDPNLFELCGTDKLVKSIIADVRDPDKLQKEMIAAEPEIVIHMAAQPLVRDSYKMPVETFSINVMGTVNLLEAVRKCKSVKSVINVTTDKCYENKEWIWGYREKEPLGGYDPYSSSKACSELATAAYRNSFFNPGNYSLHGVGIASARAGNVIGGGDWGTDRLVPDCVKAILRGERIVIRNPKAVRPWQHVLEPLSGYLLLAQNLYKDGPGYAEAWNFGPDENDAKPVEWVVKKICALWRGNASYEIDQGKHPHEASYLKLDCAKARSRLDWQPVWNLDSALHRVVEWTMAYQKSQDVRDVCLKQINEYMQAESSKQKLSYQLPL